MSSKLLTIYEPVTDYYTIKSKLHPNHVLEIQGGNHEARSYITVAENRGPDAFHQHWYLESAEGGFVYIISRLNGLVLDIKGASHAVGSYIMTFPRNTPPKSIANQRWKIDYRDGFIASQLNGQVLSIRYGNSRAGEYVVMDHKKTNQSEFQQWTIEPVHSGSIMLTQQDDEASGMTEHVPEKPQGQGQKVEGQLKVDEASPPAVDCTVPCLTKRVSQTLSLSSENDDKTKPA